ncbi:MAG TPA: hypothetical protein VEB66_05835 [Opitutaceae bacterium]|nr:hypothetical protein [Opitutaceae bacterium]
MILRIAIVLAILGIAAEIGRRRAAGSPPPSAHARGVRTGPAFAAPRTAGGNGSSSTIMETASGQAADKVSDSLARETARRLETGDARDRDVAFDRLLPRLLATDPVEAAELVAGWPPGPLRVELLGRVARLWAAGDIRGAMTWVAGLPESDRLFAAEGLLAQLSESDPAGALAASELFGVGRDDGRAERIMQLWTEQNPGEAIAWLEARPPDPTRDRLAARAAWARAQQDPADAAALALDLVAPGTAQDDALLGVIRHWAARDPAGALALVRTLPSGALQERSRTIVKQFAPGSAVLLGMPRPIDERHFNHGHTITQNEPG